MVQFVKKFHFGIWKAWLFYSATKASQIVRKQRLLLGMRMVTVWSAPDTNTLHADVVMYTQVLVSVMLKYQTTGIRTVSEPFVRQP